jgi:FixJ family two-component response regulator
MSPSNAIIFVVDDDSSVRTAVKRLIRSLGLQWKPSIQLRRF